MRRQLARLAKILGLGLVVVMVIALVAWIYWGYSPIPSAPVLSSVLQPETLEWADLERHYLTYVPRDLGPGAPLVIVLHGSNMNGSMMRIASGYEFDRLADSKRFAVVYPSGFKGHWNDCRSKATFAAKQENIDDVGFLLALITRMVERYAIDPQRVFLVGFSNGAHMAFRLALETPRSVTAIATAGASLPVAEDSSCPAQGPTPRVMLVNGTLDGWNPYDGGEAGIPFLARRGRVLSAVDSVRVFAARNGVRTECTVELMPDRFRRDGTRVIRHHCDRDGEPFVLFYSIEGGGHVFPQPVYRFPRLYGRTSREFNLPVAAVEFFGL